MSGDASAEEIVKLAAELNDVAKDFKGTSDGFRATQIREKARQILDAARDPEARAEEYCIWVRFWLRKNHLRSACTHGSDRWQRWARRGCFTTSMLSTRSRDTVV
jgi:hypothetical protein